MKPITMEQVLKTFKEYFLMTVGMMLYSFAWIGCIMPADGTGGGATGLSRVLCHAVEHWAGISIQIGTMAFLINGVLLLVAGLTAFYMFRLYFRIFWGTERKYEVRPHEAAAKK